MNYNSSLNNSNGVSRALQEANDRKARKLTFYKNGEPFSNGITVSIIPGRDFRTMEQFCSYLTDKINIANGVQYIFTTNGQRVLTLNELEHGISYVVSGIKNFQRYPYGQINKLKQIGGYSQGINRSKAVREDDLKLLRPLSSKFNTVYHNINNQPINTSYKEGRIITIVNNKDHKLRSKVLLNLKSPKSFDIILKDLGQAVRIKNAKRMFTASGHEVRSVSQLKRDMIGIDLFYLESSMSPNNFKLSSMQMKSYSLDSIKDESKQFSASNDYTTAMNQIHKISRNESNPDIISVNGFKRSDSSNMSDINPSRRGESSLSERLSLNMELMIESDYPNVSKASETQTSPDFVKSSRKNAKKMMKLEREKSVLSERFEEQNEPNIERSQTFSQNLYQNQVSNQEHNHSSKQKTSHPTHPTPTSNIKTNTLLKTPKSKRNPTKSIEPVNNKKYSKELSQNELNDTIRRDALQEYAEQLLRETALMVNNENIRHESIEKEVKQIHNKSPEKSSKVSPKNSPNKVLSDSQIENSKQELKNQNNYKNEVKDNNLNNTETETEEEEQQIQDKSLIQKIPKRIKSEINRNLTPISDRSEEKITKNQINNESKDPMENLRDGTDIPDNYLKLKWVHGFNGGNGTKNLFILGNGELAFYVGAVAILWNPEENIQRLYTQHTNDINRMSVRKTRNIIATSQEGGKGEPFALVRVWSAKDLRTYAVLTNNIFGTIVSDMDFSIQGTLMVINSEECLNLTIWDWKNSAILASSKKEFRGGESVRGAAFHQTEDDIMVSYGNKHLSVWQRRRDGTIDSRTAIKPESKAAKSINCVDFLPDHSLLTGDTTGTLTIWAPLEDENGILEFVVKEVKGHDNSLTCLQLLQNNILISGDSDGTVKTWDVNDEQFRLLNAVKLPPTSGSITSITRVHYPDRDSDAIEIYLGTSMNLILRGSALQATNYTVIFEGHSLAVRGLAVDPRYEFVYSSALDQKICKWSDSNLLWRTTAETQCVSAAVHPSGEVLAVGSVSGTIFIMSTNDGNIVSQLPVSKVCIGCLAYSPDGDLLAAGCQDGVLYILPALDNGYAYEKVSVLKGPYAILSLQWSIDSQFVLTSVNENNFQELLLWDLPNCRYMKGVTDVTDVIWFDPTCSGGEDVRGIWDNRYLQDVVNLSCHCSGSRKYLVSGDEEGFLRLFSYPCSDSKTGFFEYRQGGGSVTEVRFLNNEKLLVSSNYGGALFFWQLMPFE